MDSKSNDVLVEINAVTNEVSEKPLTNIEQEQLDNLRAEFIAEQTAKAEAAAKRETALAKLAALGLDTDDLKALGL